MNTIAEVQLKYNINQRLSDLPVIVSSTDAFNILWDRWDKDLIGYIEEFKILLVNRGNKVLGISDISRGGVNGTVTDVKVIMQTAILSNASGIILAHNHPSGNLHISGADKIITEKINAACEYLDIALLDHIILSPDKLYCSFRDELLLNELNK